MRPQKTLKLALLLSGILLLGMPTAGYANSQQGSGIRQGLPGRRISGGTRVPAELCVADAQPLVAMVPESGVGVTTSASPTLWFYLPEVDPSRQLEFSLFEQSGELLYQTRLVIPDSPGLVSVDLARLSHSPTLKSDETYRWSLAVVCNPQNRSEDLWVDGWVQRIESPANLESALATAPSVGVPQVYFEQGLWYEALAAVIAANQTQTDDPAVQAQWPWLLEMIKLDQVIALPLGPTMPALELNEVAHVLR